VTHLEYQLSSVIHFGSDMNEMKKKVKEHDEKFAVQKSQIEESNKKINYTISFKIILKTIPFSIPL
jgi:ABC-type Fe3+-citrate transport system substrate-binding protein